MKRPIILWPVAAFSFLSAITNAVDVAAALTRIGTNEISEVLGRVVIALSVCTASGWVVASLFKRTLLSRTPISIYLWFMLLVYPISNVLRAVGLNLPPPAYTPQELAAAAVFELLRYVVPLLLIVWVGFSSSLKAHLQHTGNG
jgi:hypothetical protein